MYKLKERWTIKRILRERKIILAVLTTIFTIVMYNFVEKQLNYYLNIGNKSIWTYNYNLGDIGLLLFIPSIIVSFLIIKTVEENKKIKQGILKTKDFIIAVSLVLFKIVKFVGHYTFKAVKFVGTILGLFVFWFASFINSGRSGTSSRNSRPSYSGGSTSVDMGNDSNQIYIDKQNKKEAIYQANQKQKAANHATNRAIKQANHCINSHHFTNRVNHANSLQREADAAKRNARNMK